MRMGLTGYVCANAAQGNSASISACATQAARVLGAKSSGHLDKAARWRSGA